MSTAITRRSFIATIPLCIGALAGLTGCGEEKPDLIGIWSQTNSNVRNLSMEADITDSEVVVYWMFSDGTYRIYWDGTYSTPSKSNDTWSWESERIGTSDSIFGADTDTLTFTYENETLSFEIISNNTMKHGITLDDGSTFLFDINEMKSPVQMTPYKAPATASNS